METNQNIDDKILHLVHAADLDIPPELEIKIQERAGKIPDYRKSKILRRPLLFAAAGSIASLILVFLLFSPISSRRPEPVIAEIRTEFEIPDKNIKIIFIQKSDFPLLKEI